MSGRSPFSPAFFAAALAQAENRGALAERLYRKHGQSQQGEIRHAELCRLLAAAEIALPRLNQFDAFADIPYDHPLNNAVCFAAANALLLPGDDGRFAPQEKLSPQEQQRLRAWGEAGKRPGFDAAKALRSIWAQKRSKLAALTAVHCFKAASAALSAPDVSEDKKAPLRDAVTALRAAGRPQGTPRTVTGSPDDPPRWISRTGDGPFLRDYRIRCRKPLPEPLEIVVFADVHFNFVNEKDEKEANPAILSTQQNRTWLRDGESVRRVANARNYAQFSDQTVVAGDILDYLSWGGVQLTVEHLFRTDADLLACLGGHDVTRVMQGTIDDPSSLKSRYGILRTFWPNDLRYVSRILRRGVLLIVMDNGSTASLDSALAAPLARDLSLARKEDLTVILVEHEPICTRNPAETSLPPLLQHDPGAQNFAEKYAGGPGPQWERNRKVYDLITQNADLFGAIVCGHAHSDYYTEILGSAPSPDGGRIEKKIPQIISTGVIYDPEGHLIRLLLQ